MSNPYDDIIRLPRPRWTACPPMSAVDRGAQFAPFAALTGYEQLLDEEEHSLNEGEENKR